MLWVLKFIPGRYRLHLPSSTPHLSGIKIHTQHFLVALRTHFEGKAVMPPPYYANANPQYFCAAPTTQVLKFIPTPREGHITHCSTHHLLGIKNHTRPIEDTPPICRVLKFIPT
jgi:hypothetical protein